MMNTMIDPLDYRVWGITTRWGIPLYINHPHPPLFFDGCALDVETDEHDNFVGIGMYGNGPHTDWAVYYWSDWEIVKNLVIPKFIGHNAKYDLTMLKKWGFNVDDSFIYDDTIIMSYVSDITAYSHSLKTRAVELGMPYPKYEEIVGKGKAKVTLDKQPLQLVAEYNACDCVATYKLWQKFKMEMTSEEWKYYSEIELPITRLTWKMQQQGVCVDRESLCSFKTKIDTELSSLQQAFLEKYGEVFNPRSSKQLKALGFKDGKKETLSVSERPEAQDLLRYKHLYKLSSTYLEPYLASGGVLNPEFNQVSYSKENKADEGIRTGRLSSRAPNFQNLPSHTSEGMQIRNSIIPRDRNIFVLTDYSQIELRVLSHFCKDKRMIQAFKDGRDIHQETANAIKAPRDIAKTINFAVVYGSGAWNLHQKTGIPMVEAEEFMSRFDKQFPAIHDWKQEVLYNAHKNHHVETLLGRNVKWELLPNCKKHSLKSINRGNPCGTGCFRRISAEADRRAISAIVQGSAAEIIKLAMLKLDKNGFRFPVQEHDALLFEISNWGNNNAQKEAIKDVMENIITLRVPLKVDISTGNSWGACKLSKKTTEEEDFKC